LFSLKFENSSPQDLSHPHMLMVHSNEGNGLNRGCGLENPFGWASP